MASSVRNTVGLGTGVPTPRGSSSSVASMITSKQMSGYTAQAVSTAVARNNYQTLSLSDARVQELRKYVYKMVTAWSFAHKMNIISQYGDSSLVGANPDETTLNKQVTETLIINMKQEDLEILLKDIKTDEREINKEVRLVRTERKRLAKKTRSSFGVNSFSDVAKKIEGFKKPKEIRKFLKAYDKSFKIPRSVTKQYGKLKKELEYVLKDIYNVVELAGLAQKMDIEIEKAKSILGGRYKDLSLEIARKILGRPVQ